MHGPSHDCVTPCPRQLREVCELYDVPTRRHVLPSSVEMMRYDLEDVTWTMAAPSLGDAKVTSSMADVCGPGVYTDVQVLPLLLVAKRCSGDVRPLLIGLATRITPGAGDAGRPGT